MSQRVFFDVLGFIVNCLIYGGESSAIGRIVKRPCLFKKAAVMAYRQKYFAPFFRRTIVSKKMYFLISLFLVLSLAGKTLAYDTINWDNDSGDRLWQTVANWHVGNSPQEQVPLIKDWAVIQDYADANNGPIINADSNAVARWITLGYNAPVYDEIVITIEGGTVTCTESFDMGYYMPGYYRLEINDGTVNVGGYFYGGFTTGSNATVNMRGGTLNANWNLAIGTAYSEQGTFNMMGGDVNNTSWFRIGDFAADLRPGKGHANIHGGTVETELLAMGPHGTMDITEGTLIMDGDYRGPNGYLFDPCSDDPGSGGGNYTGTIATLAASGRITAYNTNIGDIITDVNYPSVIGLRAVVKMDYDVSNPGQTTLTGDAVEPNLAWNPTPLSGSTGYSKGEVDLISWSAGDDANLHDVYFGTSFDDVNDANTTVTLGVYKTTQDLGEVNYPVSTTWDTDYFWRIDEVNGASTWKGLVWNFTTKPAWATNPSPGNNATGVSPTSAVLSWEPGPEAATHNVYFSIDFNDVNNREPSVMTVEGDPCYTPGDLDLDTLYYWAVDEVNNLEDPNVWPGPVWRFRTADYITVDNFESYANTTALTAVWDDYWTNYTGSEIFIEADANFVQSGDKSLKFTYDCGTYYETVGSRIDADAVDLAAGTDWTYGGAKAMDLFFYGDPDNSATENDRMWVELEDTSSNTGVVIYNGDPNDVKETTWHQWHIDLAIFDACGVSLPNIDKVHIGFGGSQGGQSSAGGSGTVHFDDLRLRPPYCRSGLVISDITGDCVTDELDLRLMAGDWLEYDYNVPAVPISGAPVGWWKLDEGMGLTTEDSSAYNNDGDITHASWTVGYPNDPCDSALHFDGDGIAQYDKVVCAELKGSSPGIYPAELMPAAFTVACWTKLDSFEYYGTMVAGGNDDDYSDQCGFYLYGNDNRSFGLGIRTEARMYWLQTSGIYDTDTWYHVAATYDEDANTVSIYVDGKLMLGPTNVGGPIRYISEYSESYPDYFSIGGLSLRDSEDWWYANGTIDEVRLYDYAMPHGEVVTLAEQEPAAYHPVTSAANIYDLEAKTFKKVNFMDFATMADHWLEGPVLWP